MEMKVVESAESPADVLAPEQETQIFSVVSSQAIEKEERERNLRFNTVAPI